MNKVHYMSPILREYSTDYEEDDMSRCKVTTHREHTLKDKTLKIPIRPYVHPAGLRELGRLQEDFKSSVSTIGLYIISLMNKNTKNNVVDVKQPEFVQALGISARTVTTGIGLLEEHGFITKVGKTSYKVSAKIAWYGSQMSWAKEIKSLKNEGSIVGEDYYAENESMEVVEGEVVEQEYDACKVTMPYVSPFKEH